jgi:hypothetical protein
LNEPVEASECNGDHRGTAAPEGNTLKFEHRPKGDEVLSTQGHNQKDLMRKLVDDLVKGSQRQKEAGSATKGSGKKIERLK